MIRKLVIAAGIPPDRITLTALLLITTEAALLTRVSMSQLIATLQEMQRIDDRREVDPDADLDDEPEQKISGVN